MDVHLIDNTASGRDDERTDTADLGTCPLFLWPFTRQVVSLLT